MQVAVVVPTGGRHIHSRGDSDMKYAATYKIGKSTVHVVAPPPMTESEVEKVLQGYDAAWAAAWERLSPEKRRAYVEAM